MDSKILVPLVVLVAGGLAAAGGYYLAKKAVEPAAQPATGPAGIGAVVLTPRSEFEKWYTAEGILDSLG